MPETVVILGGGVGGLVTANELRKALPKAHRIVLVERETSFVFAPSLLWLMTGGRTAEKISRPLARLANKGIEVVRGEIQRIDAARREVTVDGRSLAGHDLVIALGAELASETIPGLAEAGHNFYTLAGAQPESPDPASVSKRCFRGHQESTRNSLRPLIVQVVVVHWPVARPVRCRSSIRAGRSSPIIRRRLPTFRLALAAHSSDRFRPPIE